MIEERGDLWSFYGEGHWICITTNGITSYRGDLVMGAGVAGRAATRYPGLKQELGALVQQHGNHVFRLDDYRMFSYPTKEDWKQASLLSLIHRSAEELMEQLDQEGSPSRVYLPRPGCGLGQLDWPTVRRILEPTLDDRVVVITR